MPLSIDKIVGTATLSIIMGPAVNMQACLEDFVTDPEIRDTTVFHVRHE